MRRGMYGIAGLPRGTFTRLPNGYECYNAPSTLARQIWYYVVSLGEAVWKRESQHGHPEGSNFKDNEGFLLHFLLEGGLWHRMHKQSFQLGRNEAVLMDLTVPVEYGNDRALPAQFFWVWFNGKEMPRVFQELNADAEPVFRGLDRRRIVGIFLDLLQCTTRQPPGYEARASALLANLLAELFAVRAPRTPGIQLHEPSTLMSEPVRKALAYIARFYHAPCPLKRLSAVADVSPYHLAHLFQQQTGYSPIRYRNHYRIEQAKALLSGTRLPVEQIASRVGFGSHEHFSKLFRRVAGASPRAYRSQSKLKR